MIIITKPILTTILKQGFKFSNSQSNQIIRSYSKGLLLGQNGFNINNRNKQTISFSTLNNCKNMKGVLFFRISRQFSSTSTPIKNNNNNNNNDNDKENENKNQNGEKNDEIKNDDNVELSPEETLALRNKRKGKFSSMFNKSSEPVKEEKKEEEVEKTPEEEEKELEKELEKEMPIMSDEDIIKSTRIEKETKPSAAAQEEQQQEDDSSSKNSDKVVIEGDITTFYIYSIFSALFVGTLGIAIGNLISSWRNNATGVLGIQQFDFILLIQDIYFGYLKPAMEEGNKEFNEKTKKNYFFDEENIRHATLGDTITLIIPILQKKTHIRLGHVNVDFCKEGNEMTVQNFYINAINGYVYELPTPKQKIDTSKERYSGKYSLEELLADPTL
ncbi:hypothetical protein ACTFIU_005448 [Dictyostelium citrinum]